LTLLVSKRRSLSKIIAWAVENANSGDGVLSYEIPYFVGYDRGHDHGFNAFHKVAHDYKQAFMLQLPSGMVQYIHAPFGAWQRGQDRA